MKCRVRMNCTNYNLLDKVGRSYLLLWFTGNFLNMLLNTFLFIGSNMCPHCTK